MAIIGKNGNSSFLEESSKPDSFKIVSKVAGSLTFPSKTLLFTGNPSSSTIRARLTKQF